MLLASARKAGHYVTSSPRSLGPSRLSFSLHASLTLKYLTSLGLREKERERESLNGRSLISLPFFHKLSAEMVLLLPCARQNTIGKPLGTM